MYQVNVGIKKSPPQPPPPPPCGTIVGHCLGEQDGVKRLFGRLREECEEKDPTKRPWNDWIWILKETWRLITHRAMLRRANRLCQPGGASTTPSNWSCSLQRLEGLNRTRWREHCRRACRRQRPGGFPTPQGVVLGGLGDAIQTVLPHDGASDFGAS
jgi:hypothetical protein